MATVFWDMQEILPIEYLKKGFTIAEGVYKETIRKLKTAKQQKGLTIKMLLPDNCRVHNGREAVK
jgi:hypothetical protein